MELKLTKSQAPILNETAQNDFQKAQNTISVAYFSDDDKIRDAVLRSDAIRRRVLNACYAIPGYSEYPLKVKNRVYDQIKRDIEKEL